MPRHPVPETKKENKFPNYLQHVQPEDDSLATRTLFAGNLEINISEEELRRIFGKYGVCEDIDIKRPAPGTGNAYAFVRFQNLDMAHRAKVELSGQYIGKFQCKIGYGKATPTTRIWVGGLGSWTSITQLEREFDRFGVIKKIEYQKGDTQAYILYESIEAAQAAVKEMRGFTLGGPDRRLRIDFSDPNPPSASASFKPKPPSVGYDEPAEYHTGRPREYDSYHEQHSYHDEGGYGMPYVSRGGYRGRGRGRGSYRGAYAGGSLTCFSFSFEKKSQSKFNFRVNLLIDSNVICDIFQRATKVIVHHQLTMNGDVLHRKLITKQDHHVMRSRENLAV